MILLCSCQGPPARLVSIDTEVDTEAPPLTLSVVLDLKVAAGLLLADNGKKRFGVVSRRQKKNAASGGKGTMSSGNGGRYGRYGTSDDTSGVMMTVDEGFFWKIG